MAGMEINVVDSVMEMWCSVWEVPGVSGGPLRTLPWPFRPLGPFLELAGIGISTGRLTRYGQWPSDHHHRTRHA